MSFFISNNYFRMLVKGRVNKVCSPRIFISKTMVTNVKLAFTSVPLTHNSGCVIQKWSRVQINMYLINVS